MAKKSLDDIIRLANSELADLFQKEYREALNKRITILDLSYDSLRVNVYRKSKQHTEAFDISYNALVEVLSKLATRQYSDLSELPDNYFSQDNAPFVYINGGNSKRFIVASGYDPIDSFIRKVSRDPQLKRTLFGTNTIKKQKKDSKGRPLDEYTTELRRKVDLGHIATEGIDQLVSPLEEKLSNILEFGNKNSTSIATAAKAALQELYSLQADAQYVFKNTSTDDIDIAKNKLGEGYVVITLHRQRLNAAFSKKETQILATLRRKIVEILSTKPFHEISGSNNIEQDLVALITHALFPNKYSAPKKHNPKSKDTKNFVNVTSKVAVTSAKVSVKKQTAKADPIYAEPGSLANLQNLLNARLTEQIKQNMGDGNRKDILNLRSGRFAESVKVERLSQGRTGLITAFYTYMRNPYATFSQGGRQQYPKSRDPKLLIAKSIREIAQEQAYTRLRAVNV